MTRRSLAGAVLAIGLLGLVGVACARGPAAEERAAQAQATRASMAEIVQALQVALPLSLSDARFSDPANREVLETSLRTLSSTASQLSTHGASRDASFAYLSRSLSRDASEVLRRFEDGRLTESRFLLGQLVEDCIACHSRLQGPQGSSLGQQLLQEVDAPSLMPVERARLEVASRQFDAALTTYEQLFTAGQLSPTRLDLEGLITDYLIVAVRVKGELQRPQPTLRGLEKRSETPLYLRRNLETWRADLADLTSRPGVGSELDQARALVEEAEGRNAFPADRQGLILDLVASGMLYRFVERQSEPSEELAEAYYLLGLTETRISRSYWLSQSDFYLETAIRMAPTTPVATQAYALLEEQTLFGYTGSSGLHVPDYVLRHLEELRSLIETPPAAND